jgi:tRNA dimethylallyltransferase
LEKNQILPPMIVLTGPTAVGKTGLSIALAKAVEGEIISADSMQVYRGMDIGSAKITREEMQGVPHHMIDILEPWESFSVADFVENCKRITHEIYDRGHIPVVTGGTGFYIQALLKDVDFSMPVLEERCGDSDLSVKETGNTEEESSEEATYGETPGKYRAYLETLAREKGAAYLHELLRQADPASAEAIHANNVKRSIRALEFFHLTGRRISEHNEQEKQKAGIYNSCYFVLNDRRERLYARIEQRIDEMLAAGLAGEVQALRDRGCERGMVSMQGLGYKELLAWLEGECTYEQAVEILKRDTRHFAKRQLTWFRREKEVVWVNKDEFGYDEEKILDFMLTELRRRRIVPSGRDA